MASISISRHAGRRMLSIPIKICSSISSTNVTSQGIRYLYGEAVLGVDNYIRTRDRIHTQFINMSDKFKSKMGEFAEPDSNNMIFTEDLKNMVHLVEPKSSDDLNLVIKMLKSFSTQNKELRFGSFVFGPVVMRMFHFLNKPEEAFQIFKDEDLDGFFNQLISYQILMDLLLRNEMYNQILEVFEIIKNKQVQDARYPRNVIVLTLAACYKLNTPESYKIAMDLWKELQRVGHIPLRRATTFAAGLAINQNAPHLALEILSNIKQQNYITVRNLKLAALADLGRPEDALPILRSLLVVDDPNQRKQTISEEVMHKIKAAVERSQNKELGHNFELLDKQLVERGHISKTAMEEHLCSEITVTSLGQNRDRNVLAASFTRQGPASRRFSQRPGLHELQ